MYMIRRYIKTKRIHCKIGLKVISLLQFVSSNSKV